MKDQYIFRSEISDETGTAVKITQI